MERFKNIDWHPALEDIIDDVYIKDERMEKESVMYKIMSDVFTNPFKDIESEYANVNIELIEKYLNESDAGDEDEQKNKNDRIKEQENKSYVPGIRNLQFCFPKRSNLLKNEQVMCLRVLLRLSSDNKKVLSEKEKSELEQYMKFQEIISREQKEFLEFAKSKWDENFSWSIKCNKYVASKWKTKMQRVQKLPRYYIESMTIPLSIQEVNATTKDVKVEFTSCLWQGSFSEVIFPKFDRPCMLNMNADMLLKQYPSCVAPDKVTQHFRLPVSEDRYCESLAMEAKVDLVISSSGLKCLLNNIHLDSSNSWIIPVVVKSHHGKNVVYIDKKLPPTIATIPQKNTWVYKYILKYYFVRVANESSEKVKHMEENTEESEKPAAHSVSDNNLESNDLCNDHLKLYEEDLYLSDDSKEAEKSEDVSNVMYKLFTIGPAESLDHEQIKHVKEYQMLVRTKIDGIEMLSNGKSQPLILVPKMEHQLALGAEATTLEEGLYQWASLKFRPTASVARVRIATETAEIIQIERHTTTSLSNEMMRLYNVKVEDSLSVLHNMIEGLSSLAPGRYIMRHVPNNGPFAYIYKQVEENQKNAFDLHTLYQSKIFQTVPNTAWPPIDNMLTTPMLRCFKKMPAMFNPYHKKPTGRPRGRPKKNINQQNSEESNQQGP